MADDRGGTDQASMSATTACEQVSRVERAPGGLPRLPRDGADQVGDACGRQRWKCKGPGCGRQFTRTTPRGTPGEVKRHAIELYCLGLSMNAVAKRVGVSAQSMLRSVLDHAHAHSPKPEPARGGTAAVEIDEVWALRQKKSRTLWIWKAFERGTGG